MDCRALEKELQARMSDTRKVQEGERGLSCCACCVLHGGLARWVLVAWLHLFNCMQAITFLPPNHACMQSRYVERDQLKQQMVQAQLAMHAALETQVVSRLLCWIALAGLHYLGCTTWAALAGPEAAPPAITQATCSQYPIVTLYLHAFSSATGPAALSGSSRGCSARTAAEAGAGQGGGRGTAVAGGQVSFIGSGGGIDGCMLCLIAAACLHACASHVDRSSPCLACPTHHPHRRTMMAQHLEEQAAFSSRTDAAARAELDRMAQRCRAKPAHQLLGAGGAAGCAAGLDGAVSVERRLAASVDAICAQQEANADV